MKLTVALLTVNRRTYFSYALEAVLNQTYPNFEILVLDNHSTDDTAEYVMSIDDPRITYIRHPAGLGPDANFCSAIWMSRGQYVLITHDDDIMEPTLVERQIDFLSRYPKLLCLTTNVSLIDENNNVLQPRLYNMDHDRVFKVGDYIKTFLEEKLWLPTPTSTFRRDAMMDLLKMGGAGKETGKELRKMHCTPSGDILMSCQLNTTGPIALMAEPLLKYRQHSGQISRHIDQGQPLLDILKIIKGATKSTPTLRKHIPTLHGFDARFRIQNLFFKHSRPADIKRMARRVATIKSRLEKEVEPSKRAIDAFAPFEITLNLLNFSPFCAPGRFGKLLDAPADDGAIRGFRNWLKLIHSNRGLFYGFPKVKRIAIFGSMMAAFMLVLEARKAGVEVRCCIDTSPVRNGEQVLGAPVISLDELQSRDWGLDAVILSNERANEEGIRKLLAPYLPQPHFPIFSWKELASGSLKFSRAAEVSRIETRATATETIEEDETKDFYSVEQAVI